MSLTDIFIGRRLATSESEGERISALAGLPILGLDGLSSAAYGPEAAMAILLPLGVLGLNYIAPIMFIIIGVLIMLYFSYRQTIAAYPNGGGSYTVAKENIGAHAGLLAAAALMIDYILNVAVGISAGVGALVSAVPSLHSYTLVICLATLAVLTVVNLRGVRDTGIAFAAPTYLFILSLLITIIIGLFQIITSGGHPQPVITPPALPASAMQTAGLWLLLRTFASGCTAMTGVEAVSNATGVFIEPKIDNARRSLTYIVATLAVLLAGIAYLAQIYHIGAMDETKSNYETVLSQLIEAITGRGIFYYVSLTSIIIVLALSANTSFAGFPRVTRLLALDGYLPHSFYLRGQRLVYSIGILFLSGFTAFLLIIFDGITDALIPLFAVGAFLAFTLSQAGMVMHWRKNKKEKHALAAGVVNGIGALATGVALAIILIAKFMEGAWITVLLIPALLLLFRSIKSHYNFVAKATACPTAVDLYDNKLPITVVPVDGWNILAERALHFAMLISSNVTAVHVQVDEARLGNLKKSWQKYVVEPTNKSGIAAPKLVILPSPYRLFRQPFLDYVLKLEKENPGHMVAVVVPELVQSSWYQYILLPPCRL